MKQHVSEARVYGQLSHLAAVSRETALCIDRFELGEKLATLRERRGRRRVEPVEFRGISDAGGGKFQRKRSQIGVRNLRGSGREQCVIVVLCPEAIAYTGLEAPGTSP